MIPDMQDYQKEYYKKNKNKWLDLTCCPLCGKTYCRSANYHHVRSKKHLQCVPTLLIESNNDIIHTISEYTTNS